MPKNEDEIGALWDKGNFLSGVVNGKSIVVFKNTFKQAGSNAPDYRILKARPRPDGKAKQETTDDDIPF